MNVRICPVSWSLYQQALSELAHTRNTETCLKRTTAYVLRSKYSLWANDSVFSFLLIFKFHLQSRPNHLHMDFRSSPAVLTKVVIAATIQQGSVVHQLFLSVWPNVWFQDGPVQPLSVPSCCNPMQKPQFCWLPSATIPSGSEAEKQKAALSIWHLLCLSTVQHHYAHSIGLQMRVVSCMAVCDRSRMPPCTKLHSPWEDSVVLCLENYSWDWRDS